MRRTHSSDCTQIARQLDQIEPCLSQPEFPACEKSRYVRELLCIL